MALKLLSSIAPILDPPTQYRLLHRLSMKADKVSFPEVKKAVGIHKFYEEDEVIEWWSFWIEITKGHREGQRKRGKR